MLIMPAYRFRGSPHGSRQIRRGCFVNTEEINPHLTAKIVVSYVRHQRLGPDQLSDLITSVHRTIGQLGQPSQPEEVRTPAVSVRRSVHRDYVVCLDCGYRGKTLRRHISTRHGLSPDEYRRRWGLRSNHPLRLPFILSIVRPWQGHEASVAGSPHLRSR